MCASVCTMITPFELTCEYAVNPLGVDAAQPRFSWLLKAKDRGQMQSAYQVLVAPSEEALRAGSGDKWDSGKVAADESVNVPYAGSPLASAEKCWWKVRVWDADGAVSAYSEAATFEMGLLNENDWEGAWIGANPAISAPLLRQEFEVAGEVKSARAYISGIGWYELYLNGQKVGDHVLDPATTDYATRVLYATYDVSELLREGTNAVGAMLGNGWYSEPGWKTPYGDSPRLLLQMNVEYADGRSTSIRSDGNWKTSGGPITHNDLYGGETYDARLEKPGWASAGYDLTDWDPAVVKEAPGGRMKSQLMPPIVVNQTIKPVKLTRSRAQPGAYVYDMGQLFGGWARLRVKGERGTAVTIKYSARVFEESGLVDKRRHKKGNETDTYTLRGDPEGEIYEPRFTYHPVRYVQIEGYPGEPTVDDMEGRVVHSAVDLSGDFGCSNPLLNRIHQNVVWTLTNGLYGIPLDCLHREHWAWTDPATVAGSLYPRKHMPLFWTKWLDDIKDAQGERGEVPDIAPNYVRRQDPDPAWGSNYPILVWYLYQYYGDIRILQEHYPGMKRWVDYLTSIAENHLVTQGHYGDHMLPGEAPGKETFISQETPPPLLWTGYYYRDACIISQAAETLDRADDAANYARLAEQIKDALHAEWFDQETDQYATGSQTANLFPLALGIVPKGNETGVVGNVIKDIVEEYDYHHHTGNTGATCMIDALTQHGQGELLYQVVTQKTYPGWGYMVEQGATTIWESWSLASEVGVSENMIMWATIDEFFYDLAGIKGPDYHGPGYMRPGFCEIHIEPHVLGDLEHASASIKTVRGMVSSSWVRDGQSITLEVTLPVNSRAKVSVPKMGHREVTITESGEVVWHAGAFVGGVAGIVGGSESRDYVTLDAGSGSYSFELSGTPA